MSYPEKESPLIVMIRDKEIQVELTQAAIQYNMTEDEVVEHILTTIVALHLLPKFLNGGIKSEFPEA